MSDIEAIYRARHSEVLTPLARRLEDYLRTHFQTFKRIDRIAARAKAIDRFVAKATKVENGQPRYSEPLEQIQDQIGARVIVFYLQDVEVISRNVEEYFRKIESQAIVPDSEAEFGYFGKHFVLFLPSELFDDVIPAAKAPKFFELQIKTLYQHAWLSFAKNSCCRADGASGVRGGISRVTQTVSTRALWNCTTWQPRARQR